MSGVEQLHYFVASKLLASNAGNESSTTHLALCFKATQCSSEISPRNGE
jgi:hypothetical protein